MESPVISKELFWRNTRETVSLYSPESAVIVQGKTLCPNAKRLQEKMFNSCTVVSEVVKEFFKDPPKFVLDLGSGMGANTLPMAKAGSHITAIDSSIELLERFSKFSKMYGCPKENFRLRKGNIETMESYGEKDSFDLVVAVDILPYVSPNMLESTMEKIQKSLKNGGIIVGTIFSTEANPIMREAMGKLGAHFYAGGQDFVEKLLDFSGFTVEVIERNDGTGFYFKARKNS
jgi:predicted TPR repeat methyltransferase